MKDVYVLRSKWTKAHEETISEYISMQVENSKDSVSGEIRVIDDLNKCDEVYLFGYDGGFISDHITEFKTVGVTPTVLESIIEAHDNNKRVKLFKIFDYGSKVQIHNMGEIEKRSIEIDKSKLSESKVDKGNRNERRAIHICEKLYGESNVEIVNDNYGKDPFGLIDIIVMDEDIKFIQVKSNSNNTKKYQKILEGNNNTSLSNFSFELWNRKDRVGWEIFRATKEENEIEFKRIAEAKSCDKDEVVDILRGKEY